jgi:hypothetical protein
LVEINLTKSLKSFITNSCRKSSFSVFTITLGQKLLTRLNCGVFYNRQNRSCVGRVLIFGNNILDSPCFL